MLFVICGGSDSFISFLPLQSLPVSIRLSALWCYVLSSSFSLSSVVVQSYRFSERIFLSSSHFNFLFFLFLISSVQPSSNFFSISLFLLHIYVLCLLPLFRFCPILWSFTVYIGVHFSSSNIHLTYLHLCFPIFLGLFILIIPVLCITDQYTIIPVLKCLSDSLSPVPNTFAIASLLDCSSSLQYNKYLYSFISCILSPSQLYSVSLFDLLSLPAIRIFDFSLFSCNFFTFSQLSNFFSIVQFFFLFPPPAQHHLHMPAHVL